MNLPALPWILNERPIDGYARGYAVICAQAAIDQERERCLAACLHERLTDDTGTDGDIAYNLAIDHCAAAIRR